MPQPQRGAKEKQGTVNHVGQGCLTVSKSAGLQSAYPEPEGVRGKTLRHSLLAGGRGHTHRLAPRQSVQSLSRVRLFATPRIAAGQASLSITNSRSLLKLMSTELVMPSNHLILCCPLLLPPSGSFPESQLFASGGQSTGVSASTSVLPMNIQD